LKYLGLYNKPKAEVHPGHKLTGQEEEKEEEEEEEELPGQFVFSMNEREVLQSPKQ
jgi:hypothetical protein